MVYVIPHSHDPLYKLLASYLIGFVRLSAKGMKLSQPQLLGSGTLVYLGEIFGILTAAHVIEEVAREREIGLMTFHRTDAKSAFKLTFEPEDVAIAVGWTGTDGSYPDLAFLRITDQERIATLKARGSTFHNLGRRPSYELPSNESALQHFNVCGVVDATRTVEPAEHDVVNIGYTAMFAPLTGFKWEEGRRIVEVWPNLGGRAPPRSYGGMSGGPLWLAAENSRGTADCMLAGVIFYEFYTEECVPQQLKCCSILAVGDALWPAMKRQFSKA